MQRKLFINLALLLVVFTCSAGSILWYLKSIRSTQDMVKFFHVHIQNLADLFYLGTLVQQQQSEIMNDLNGDINPLVENVIQISRFLEKTSKDLNDPIIIEGCRDCHQKLEDERWRSLAPQIDKLQETLSTYKLYLSEIITGSGFGANQTLDEKTFRTSNDLVVLSGQVKKAFDKMEVHLVLQNADWADHTQKIMLVTLSVAFIFIVLIIFRFTRQIVNPILQLEEATRALSMGDYPAKLAIKSADELGSLAKAFNHMVEVLRKVTNERETLLAESRTFNQVLAKKIEETRAELKAAEEHLVRTETLSAVGTLAAGISHEISNPIHIIMGICSLAQKDLDPGSDTVKDLKMIEDEAQRCQKIVNSLLDFARRHDFEKVLTSVNRLIEESLILVLHQKWSKNIQVVRELQPDLTDIMADPNRIKQVLVNLFINAAQAMPDGGTLTLRSGSMKIGGKDSIAVTVADTGVGMPKDVQKKIFDPFFTTKKGKEGTGLGLAISHRIISEHGGLISCQSEPGKGTIFTILLPVRSEDDKIEMVPEFPS